MSLFVSNTGLFVPYFYILDFATALNRHSTLSPTASFYVLAALNAGGIPGRILPAWLADVVGRFNLLIPSGLL